MKHKFKVGKILRDNWLEFMKDQGQNISYKILEGKEYEEKLREKIVEEANEVLLARNREEICEELGDVLEVIKSLALLNNLTFEDIVEKSEEKKKKRGSFDKRVYVDFVEIDSNNIGIKYYLDNPNKYPEISSEDK